MKSDFSRNQISCQTLVIGSKKDEKKTKWEIDKIGGGGEVRVAEAAVVTCGVFGGLGENLKSAFGLWRCVCSHRTLFVSVDLQ